MRDRLPAIACILYILATLLFAPWHVTRKDGYASVDLAPVFAPPSYPWYAPSMKIRFMAEVIAVEWAAMGLAVWLLRHRTGC